MERRREEIRKYATAEELTAEAAEFFRISAAANIARTGRFTVALSGGSTPLSLYAHLGNDIYRHTIEWDKIFFFWGDERYVSVQSDESNARSAIDTLLFHVPVPQENIFLINTELPPAECAAEYENRIRNFFRDDICSFDLIFLGMGSEGHVASLFPYSMLLHEKEKLIGYVFVKEKDQYRISFTPRLINAAKKIVFLVTGRGKSAMLHTVLTLEEASDAIPASLIRPQDGELIWMIDEAASELLDEEIK